MSALLRGGSFGVISLPRMLAPKAHTRCPPKVRCHVCCHLSATSYDEARSARLALSRCVPFPTSRVASCQRALLVQRQPVRSDPAALTAVPLCALRTMLRYSAKPMLGRLRQPSCYARLGNARRVEQSAVIEHPCHDKRSVGSAMLR